MVSIVDERRPHLLARPFLGVGLLGGYTSFSTDVVETVGLIQARDPGTAFVYFGGDHAPSALVWSRRSVRVPWAGRLWRVQPHPLHLNSWFE